MRRNSENTPPAPSRRDFVKVSALAGGASLVPGQQLRGATLPKAIPAHRALPLTGVHLYTDAVSYRAGDTLQVHASATVPHRIDLVRHDEPSFEPQSDPVLHGIEIDKPVMQPVHPGSYIHVASGLTKPENMELTLECWVRPWNAHEPQGIITQLDNGNGFGLLLFPDGSIGFYTGDTDDPAQTAHRTDVKLTLPESDAGIAFVVPPAPWHHVVATAGDGKRAVWIDGRKAGEWSEAAALQFIDAPLRIGALGRDGEAAGFLDADIAMPTIYGRVLDGIEIRTRHTERGLRPPDPETDQHLLACWPLDEEAGDAIRDLSSHGRHGRLINHGTWMIGGPSFLPAVPRYKKDYDPANDTRRGHGLRLASDDLYDCRWQVSHQFDLPKDAKPGFYSIRATFDQDGEEVTRHAFFVVRRARDQAASPIAFLVGTNTFKAYCGGPFASAWSGTADLSMNGYQARKDDPVAPYCFYRFHRAGQPAYQMGWRIPCPAASPYALRASTEKGYAYAHLTASHLWSYGWLGNQGYSCDTLSDYDLEIDPDALDGAKVLFIVGHNEYWSLTGMRLLQDFLDRGGKIVNLSGNTMYWRVTFSDDGNIMECRKADAWGAQLAGYMRGECWHAHDKHRGGVPRDCGLAGWEVLGTEFASAWSGIRNGAGRGAFHAADAAHPFFHTPNLTGLKTGDRFGFDPQDPGRHPIGHEGDVLVSNLMDMSRRAGLPHGIAADLDDPAGITLLAQGRLDSGKIPGAYREYFTHDPVSEAHRRPDDSICDMIHWKRPGGGEVFAAPSIAAGWTLGVCPKWSALLKNVLHHFGVEPNA